MRKSLIAALFVVLFMTSTSEAQRKEFNYETGNVTVTGRIVFRTFYGPPNYGENPKTDSRETQAILLLDSPIDVIGTSTDDFNVTERGVKELTLVWDQPLRPLRGKRVIAQGSLFHAHTGHHHTKVLMSVTSVRRR